MGLKLFVYKEKYKIIATLILISFFLFFWINGPINQETVSITNNAIEDPTFNSKLVGTDSVTIKSYNEVDEVEEGGDGYSLILSNKKNKKDHFGLIKDKSNNIVVDSNYIEKLRLKAISLIPNALTYSFHSSSPLHYILIKTEEDYSIYIESEDLSNSIRGYAGPINIGLLINEDGSLIQIEHVSSRETESYLKKLIRKGFYDQFKNLKTSDSYEIDAISGATISSEAIAKTSTYLVELIKNDPVIKDYLSLNEINSFSVQASLKWYWIIHISIIFILFYYGFQRKYKKSKRDVLIVSIMSVIYIGFFLNNSFTYISFIHPFIGTSVSSMVAFYALFTLLGSIWGKNTYCKYVCPYGNAQKLLLNIFPKRIRRPFFISNKWVNRIRDGLTICLIVGVLLGFRNWSNFEVFPDFFGIEFTSVWFIISLLLILLNLRYPFIWCRLLCPTGSVLDNLSKATNRS